MRFFNIGHEVELKCCIKGNENMTFEEALQILQDKFRNYIKTQVLSKVEVDDLGKNLRYKYSDIHFLS